MSFQYIKYIEAIMLTFRSRDLYEINGQAKATCKAAKHATVTCALVSRVEDTKTMSFMWFLRVDPERYTKRAGDEGPNQ
jgi:hypothetical protein